VTLYDRQVLLGRSVPRGRIDEVLERARDLLQQARAIFVDLDAEPWAQRADEEDGRSARSLRPADVARDQLTASEHQVASLAVRGLQNREIAGRLFMSVKTVEAHLTRIYRKLGVRTRVELVHRYRPQLDE
jgi:DNA-binding NarL/FixJ family response regulator